MCEHVRAVSVERFTQRRGFLSDQAMSEVMKRLKVLLMLGRKGAA